MRVSSRRWRVSSAAPEVPSYPRRLAHASAYALARCESSFLESILSTLGNSGQPIGVDAERHIRRGLVLYHCQNLSLPLGSKPPRKQMSRETTLREMNEGVNRETGGSIWAESLVADSSLQELATRQTGVTTTTRRRVGPPAPDPPISSGIRLLARASLPTPSYVKCFTSSPISEPRHSGG